MFSQFLGHFLKVIYDVVGNYGLSIIIFTLGIKLLLLPLALMQTKSMKGMQDIQPKIKEIQTKYKNDAQKMNENIMALYKEHKVNPMAGCLPVLVQLPILYGLFNVLNKPVKYVFGTEAAYKAIDSSFLWLSNLSHPDIIHVAGISIPWILPILAGITTYIQSAMMMPKEGKKDPTQTMMLYMFPVMMLFWGLTFPAGLTLYWTVSNIFTIIQQQFILKPVKPKEV